MSDNNYYVYEWIRLDKNETFYVGKGTGNRAFVPKKNNDRFMNIYKDTPMVVSILEENLTDEEAKFLEKEYIYDYVFNQGYAICISGYRESEVGELANCTWGGDGSEGRVCTDDCKKKISKANKGKSHPQTEATKGIISNRLKEHKRTEEHSANIAKALKGRIVSPKSLEKMIEWTRTAIRSETHKENISLALKDKKKSKEHKENISKTMKEKGYWKGEGNPKAEGIVVIFPNGEIKEFKTKTEAGEIVPRTIIRRCLKEQKPYKVPKMYRKKYGYLEGVIIKLVNDK